MVSKCDFATVVGGGGGEVGEPFEKAFLMSNSKA